MALFNQDVQDFINNKLKNALTFFKRAICELQVPNKIKAAKKQIIKKNLLNKLKPCDYNLRIASESAWGATICAIDALIISENI